MIIIKGSAGVFAYMERCRKSGIVTGFVPTMGALHGGHLALIKEARKSSGAVACSIFVNPTQFNDPSDYQKYPVTPESDIQLLETAGTDILFLPSVTELYPAGTANLAKYDLGYLETVLEGSSRPGHFQGVCQVMQRLLSVVQPDLLFMGQKDYQQCMVIRRLIELMNIQVKLIAVATIREHDGLAMSSRNIRLSAGERRNAAAIYQSLLYIKEHLQPGNLSPVLNNASSILLQHHFRIDYVVIAAAGTLQLVTNWDGREPLIALIAAFQNDVRLIDNMILHG